MSSQFLNIPQHLIFRYETPRPTGLELEFLFGFTPDQPGIGEPGNNAGDLVLIKHDQSARLQVSLGKKSKCNPDTFRKAGGLAGKWLIANHAAQIGLSASDLEETAVTNALNAFLEGLRLGVYSFDLYKKQDSPKGAVEVLITSSEESPALRAVIARVNAITDAVTLARDWAHEPANVINPITLAERASALADQIGLKSLVLDDHDLEALHAGAILAVGRGSRTPPRLITIEYPGSGALTDSKPVVLVGKALTFDSGGYSIKSTDGIQGMKYDKCGGIAVLATLFAAARLKLAMPLIGIIASAENMISQDAYRPDDIITTLSGKTVEIVSTDAEGRLVLADALTYAQKIYHPRAIIDLATLTGGVVTALGRVRAGVMGNDAALIQALIESGERTAERLWQLPLDDDYLLQTIGEDADLKNSGGREGHAILGGIFLKQFVDDAIPWAHLDIAGVADIPKDLPYQPKGATGFGVRLLLDYIEKLS